MTDSNEIDEKVIENIKSFLFGMAGGSARIAEILFNIFSKSPEIDPSNVLAEAGPIVVMINLEILGNKISVLHHDICGDCYIKTIGLLRAAQLGIVKPYELNAAFDSPAMVYRLENKMPEIMAEIYEKIPDFKKI